MAAIISMKTRFKCADRIISSDIGEEIVMMSIDKGKYYSLKGPSGRVWQLIQDGQSVGSIIQVLLNEYDVQPEQCEEELLSLLRDMRDGSLIEIDDAATSGR
jgi:hypothetical protein